MKKKSNVKLCRLVLSFMLMTLIFPDVVLSLTYTETAQDCIDSGGTRRAIQSSDFCYPTSCIKVYKGNMDAQNTYSIQSCSDTRDTWISYLACCTCIPDTCVDLAALCGSLSDGCGHTLDCGPNSIWCQTWFGTCEVTGTKTCSNGQYGSCVATDPTIATCATKECGFDGCGGLCAPETASCSEVFGTCTATGTKTCIGTTYGDCSATDPAITNCAGKNCGDDGCGDVCGTCSGDETCMSGVCTPNFIDIGLKVYYNSQPIKIAVEPLGTITSPLRIAKGGQKYGVVLVSPTDPSASKVRIVTGSTIKALRKYTWS